MPNSLVIIIDLLQLLFSYILEAIVCFFIFVSIKNLAGRVKEIKISNHLDDQHLSA